MGMRIPPLKTKIMLEPNTLKSRILVRRLAVSLRLAARRSGKVVPPKQAWPLGGEETRACIHTYLRKYVHTMSDLWIYRIT